MSQGDINMSMYEFWIDDDFENKKSGTLSGKSALISELNVDDYSEGIHLLHIRAKDGLNRYSVAHSAMFYKFKSEADNTMESFEYWIDDDFEEKKSGTLSGKSALITELNADDYSEGIHLLHIRAKDGLNRYSIVHSAMFYKFKNEADNVMASFEP